MPVGVVPVTARSARARRASSQRERARDARRDRAEASPRVACHTRTSSGAGRDDGRGIAIVCRGSSALAALRPRCPPRASFQVRVPSRKAWAPSLFDRFRRLDAPRPTRFSATRSASCASTIRAASSDRRAFTQPALFVVNAMTYRARIEDGAAGAGVRRRPQPRRIQRAPGGRRVRLRDRARARRAGAAELMGEVRGGGMAAVIGLEPARIEAVLAASDAGRRLDVANFNSFDQTVIAGPKDDLAAVKPRLRGGRRARVHPAQRERALPFALHARCRAASSRRSRRRDVPRARDSRHRQRHRDARTTPTPRASTLARQIGHSVRWLDSMFYHARPRRDRVRGGRTRDGADEARRADPQETARVSPTLTGLSARSPRWSSQANRGAAAADRRVEPPPRLLGRREVQALRSRSRRSTRAPRRSPCCSPES